VPERGLEPPQCFHHQDLNLARLPIPPSGQRSVTLANVHSPVNLFSFPGKHFGK